MTSSRGSGSASSTCGRAGTPISPPFASWTTASPHGGRCSSSPLTLPSPPEGERGGRLTSGRSPPNLAALHVKPPMVRLVPLVRLAPRCPDAVGLAAVPGIGARSTPSGPATCSAITVWGQADLSRDYAVDPDGFIPFPADRPREGRGVDPEGAGGPADGAARRRTTWSTRRSSSRSRSISRRRSRCSGRRRSPACTTSRGPRRVLEILSKAGGLASTAGKQVILLRNHRPPPTGTASADRSCV